MKLAIIGSTGSIGTQALDLVQHQEVEVVALTCGSNGDLLMLQYHQFKPKYLVIEDLKQFNIIKEKLKNESVKVLFGLQGLIQMTEEAEYDVLLTSVVGSVGLQPTISAVKRGKRIALANKETLVVYGEEIMALARRHKAEIIPVDSEHSALFQALQGNSISEIEKIILTASGGPFLGKTRQDLMAVHKSAALKHPKWSMGAKISIDSSTLMNKGLEVIEARWLFDVTPEQIEVVVHPQSIIHSLIQYVDGSVMAQMGLPDMKLPIHYALHYPNRLPTDLERMVLPKLHQLTFYEPDRKTFPCLDLAYEVLRLGGTAPCILNAANEELVARFLNDEIGFYDIPNGIEKALSVIGHQPIENLEMLLAVDATTRQFAKQCQF